VAGLSETMAGGLGEMYSAQGVTSESVDSFYASRSERIAREIEELAFQEDAILCFIAKVSAFGGWDEYLAACEEEVVS